MRGNFGAVVLIVIGVLALAINLKLIEVDLAQLLRTWWPVLLIVLGIGMFSLPAPTASETSARQFPGGCAESRSPQWLPGIWHPGELGRLFTTKYLVTRRRQLVEMQIQ